MTSTSNDFSEIIFGQALPTSTKIVKCVLQQAEDMTTNGDVKFDISKVGLKLTVREKPSGGCAKGVGNVTHEVSDYLNDDKHMVAVLDSDHELGGRCIEVLQDVTNISATDGQVTTHMYCYSDNQLDY